MDLDRRVYIEESFNYIRKMSGKFTSENNPTKVNYIDECSKFFGSLLLALWLKKTGSQDTNHYRLVHNRLH